MAKSKSNTVQTADNLQAARQDLKQAQNNYEDLIRQNTAKMSEEERQKHLQACREALIAKKETARIVQELELGKKVN